MGQLQETNGQLAATQSRLNSLNLQLIDSRAKLAAIDAQLDVVSAALQQKSAQLQTLLGVLDAQQTVVNKRIADIYINAPTGYSQALAQSQDFADVVTANQFAGSVLRADATTMAQLEQTEATVSGQRVDIANHQASIVKARNAQAAPCGQNMLFICTRQRAQVWKGAQEPLVVNNDHGHARLLQHDL